jgi:curved DNA-binding protein CbpA
MHRSYYEILEVSPDSEPEHIEYAYKAKVLTLQGKHDGVSAEELKMVRWAYKMLMDPEKRAEYDLKLKKESFQPHVSGAPAAGDSATQGAGRSKWVAGLVVGIVVLVVLYLALR